MSAIGICSKTRVFKPHISLYERLPKVQRYYLSAHTYHTLTWDGKNYYTKQKHGKVFTVKNFLDFELV